MKRRLTRKQLLLHHFYGGKRIKGVNPNLHDNCSDLYGDCSRLYGNCSNVCGNCTGLWGILDDCEITELINIQELVQ